MEASYAIVSNAQAWTPPFLLVLHGNEEQLCLTRVSHVALCPMHSSGA